MIKKKNKNPGIFYQIKDVNVLKYNELSMEKLEELLNEITGYNEKLNKIKNSIKETGPKKKLNI